MTLKWQAEPPTEPGWYWVKTLWSGKKRITEVSFDEDMGEFVEELHNGSCGTVMHGPGYRWAGPIPEPEEE